MTPDERALMDAFTIVFDGLEHLGPGDAGATRSALALVRPQLPEAVRVADLGCGVGASALVLAESLPGARVLAVDTHAPFVERLRSAARARGLSNRIASDVGDMAAPPPLDGRAGQFDLIWSESAIYNLGRTNAFETWRPMLAPGGWLVFSEIVWARDSSRRSERASVFWTTEYPAITGIDGVMAELTTAGFHPREPLVAGREAWAGYYEPLRARVAQLREEGGLAPALAELVAGLVRELEQYDVAGDIVELVFFAAASEPSAPATGLR